MSDPARLGPDDGDPTGWFDRLYAAAQTGDAVVPWDRGFAHPLVAAWVATAAGDGAGRRALVVGAGPGYDAELVAAHGFATVAFDVAPTAVAAARRRFPGSPVAYEVADLLDLPAAWLGAFDLVVESLTVQSLPDPPRRAAIGQVARLVAPGGTLLVVAFASDDDEPEPDGPPWPLTRGDLAAFAVGDLAVRRLERFDATEETAASWRAELVRAAPDAAGPPRAPG